MQDRLKFYIDGQWVDPIQPKTLEVINPATEQPIGRISLGSAADVDRAVKAARAAFETFSRTKKEERIALLSDIARIYPTRYDEIARTITSEMGAPSWLSKAAQAATGIGHLNETIKILKDYEFSESSGTTLIAREPVGVCGFITPWNWPVNQIMCKVAPALAAGCTMVLKPSEVAPLNAMILAEIFHEAGVPKGVFNLVNGDGPTVGAAISSHPGIDMVSFTGSTRAGVAVAQAAAPTVKRVTQELGGKSANMILDDADFADRGRGRRARLLPEQRAVVQRADAHAGAGEPAGGGDRDRQGHRRAGQGGRSRRPGRHDRPGGERGAVQEDPGPDPEGHRRRRHARRRRHRPSRRPREGLLREAHRLRRT